MIPLAKPPFWQLPGLGNPCPGARVEFNPRLTL